MAQSKYLVVITIQGHQYKYKERFQFSLPHTRTMYKINNNLDSFTPNSNSCLYTLNVLQVTICNNDINCRKNVSMKNPELSLAVINTTAKFEPQNEKHN